MVTVLNSKNYSQDKLFVAFLIFCGLLFSIFSQHPTSLQSSPKYVMERSPGHGRPQMAAYDYNTAEYMPSLKSSTSQSLQTQKIVKSGSISVTTESNQFDELTTEIKGVFKSSNIRITSESTNINSFNLISWSLQLEVPSENLDSLVNFFKQHSGLSVRSISIWSHDDTHNYQDSSIELEIAKEALSEFESIYKTLRPSEKINHMHQLESHKRDVRYLEKRINSIDSKVIWSSVSVTISQVKSTRFDWVSQILQVLSSQLLFIFVTLLKIFPWALVGIMCVFVKNRYFT